jgi:hypothetical protein
MLIAAWDNVLRCHSCFLAAGLSEPTGDEANRCDYCGKVATDRGGVHPMLAMLLNIHFTAGLCDTCYQRRNQVIGHAGNLGIAGNGRRFWLVFDDEDPDEVATRLDY